MVILAGEAAKTEGKGMKPTRVAAVSERVPAIDAIATGGVRINRYLDASLADTLAADATAGLRRVQKALPPKYFYDERGSRLFDAICDVPEYYLTRTEQALLEGVSAEIIALTRPTHLIELGSGTSRKTRLLLDALTDQRPDACYVPIDVSEETLRQSALTLRGAYPSLQIHAIVGDYERHLIHVPRGGRRLVIFLGSTIGNFTRDAALGFLQSLGRLLRPDDALLLGLDLVKPVERLHAAYNDAAGLTAEFNRNLLRVLNRELAADFRLEQFEHLAFYDARAAQIEMHLRAAEAHEVAVPALGLTVSFARGETIHTEISRKFSRAEGDAMLAAAGCEALRWYVAPDDAFALALGLSSPAARRGPGAGL